MTQVTLSTMNGDINIMGAYWPNKHGPNTTSDQNLWKCLQRYILKHRMIDRSPTDLMQRTAGIWTQTAIKNGAHATILCGDLNATWTGAEGGGQSILNHWADGLSFSNGIRTIAQQRNEHMYTRGEEGQPTTWIDHVLHKGNAENINIVEGFTSQAAVWEGITDHRPIWGGYIVNSPAQPTPRKTEMTKVRWELRLTDRTKCDEYTEAMEKFEKETDPPCEESSIDEIFLYMEKLHSHMSTTVKRLYHNAGQDKRFSSHKDGWSPTYIAYKAHLTALVMIRRHVTGQKKQRKWKDQHEMEVDIGAIIEDWDNKLTSLDIADEQLAVIQNCTIRNRDWWSTTTVIPELKDIDKDINQIKQLLHGANRREFRRRINAHVRAREDKRRAGKWSQVLNSVLGTLRGRKGQEAVDLDVVQARDGSIVGDPTEIHDITSNEFDEVFYGKPVWCKGAMHEGTDWERCLHSETFFLKDTEYTNVPEEHRRLLYKAITNVSRRETVENELKDILKSPPTLVEFEEGIRRAKTNSSAGISGVSYNMLKRLPAALVKTLHSCLVRIWESQEIPEWWTERWLVPIPKKEQDVTNITNLRPLILVEAVRKIWCKLLLQRILRVWKKHDVLQHTQHGFRAGYSTTTASIMFLNTLEDAIENDLPVHTSSWDITRAFDSVSKNVMRLAWARLGVPLSWIQWLIALDDNGLTVVRTPHAVRMWDKKGRKGFRRKDKKLPSRQKGIITNGETSEDKSSEDTALGFVAERGTGQGDVMSPTCWGAVFDILLTMLALDAEHQKGRWIKGTSNQSYRMTETAYADDLLSYAPTAAELQRKADIVSAFCVVMGLQLSTSKLRRFVMIHSGLDGEANATVVHHKHWMPESIAAQNDGTLEYLGGLRDVDGSSRTELEVIKDIAKKHCAEIQICAARSATKIGIVDTSTYGKLRYKGKLMSTTLTELQQVDKIVYKFHTKATKQMATFPYELMYLDASHGGGGLKRFSDLNSLDKLAELQRGLRRTDEIQGASQGLLQRVLRAKQLDLHENFRTRYDATRGTRHWLRSTLEWLGSNNLYLWRGGVRPDANWLSSPIQTAYPDMPTALVKRLRKHRILHVGDLIDDSYGSRCWKMPRGIQLLDYLQEEPPSDNNMIIWPGQYWRPQISTAYLKASDVIEILQIEGQHHLHVAIWTMVERTAQCEWYEKHEDTYVMNKEDLFPHRKALRVDQEGYRRATQRCKFSNERATPTPMTNVALPVEEPSWVTAATDFIHQQTDDYRPRIYTDGAYDEEDYDLHTVFAPEAVKAIARASIVIMHDGEDWRNRPIFTMHIADGEEIAARSAFTMEYIAIAAAMRMQTGFKATATCSDCLAVIKILRNRHKHLDRSDCSHRILLHTADKAIKAGKNSPQWIQSHVERRKKDNTTWNMDEWGNYLADKTAEGSDIINKLMLQVTHHEVTAMEILRTIPQTGDIYIGDSRGYPVALNGIMDHVHSLRFTRYLDKRDQGRHGQPRWYDNTIPFAAEVYNGKVKSVGRYAHTARIVYDKHWHGRNRSKAKDQMDQDNCSKCHLCGEQDSQAHGFRWCRHSNITAIREEMTNALQGYLDNVRNAKSSPDTAVDNRLKIQFIQGIKHEFHNCEDASRVWTGNWSRTMINRMERQIGMGTLTKKQCKMLRKILFEMYEIISQGACDILEVRHNVAAVQASNEQWAEAQAALEKGQRRITDYIINSQGITGMALRKQMAQEMQALEEDIADEYDETSISETNNADEEELQDDWRWMPKVADSYMEKIQGLLTERPDDAHIITQEGNTYIKAGSIRNLLNGEDLSSDIINGFTKKLQRRLTRRHVKIFSTSFFERLYNPTGSLRYKPKATLDCKEINGDTRNINIFDYQLLLIPIWLGNHWTHVAVDNGTRQIRYMDSGGEGGNQYLLTIRRWLKTEWKRFYKDNFPNWRTLPSMQCTVPQQLNEHDCGVYMLMFMELQTDGQDINLFVDEGVEDARKYITYCLLKENLDINATALPPLAAMIEDKLVIHSQKKAAKGIRRKPCTVPQLHYDGKVTPDESQQASFRTDADSNWIVDYDTEQYDMVEAIESLQQGEWISSTVIDRYSQLLNQRQSEDNRRGFYMPTQFFQRFYDHSTQTHALHPSLYDIHGPRLLEHEFIFVPINRPLHWASIAVYPRQREIHYMDTYYFGGEQYAKAMAVYLTQYERDIEQSEGRKWIIKGTTHSTMPTRDQVSIPRQIGGDDCGVFVCMFADILQQGRNVQEADQTQVVQARENLIKSLLDKKAYSLITEENCTDESLMTKEKGITAYTGGSQKDITLRRSTRRTKAHQSLEELHTPADINYNRLSVRRIPDMGWGLFAKENISFTNDRVICTYIGRRISARTAKAKNNKSQHILEMRTESGSRVYVDGFDSDSQLCYSIGPYANDGINNKGRKDLWNAEFAVDDYDPNLFVIRPTRDILAGEQIYVWYGPSYWCSDDHPIEHLVMAIMTYGIDIDKSTEHTHGDWTRLRSIERVRAILKDKGYTAPRHITNPMAATTAPTTLVMPITDASDQELDLLQLPKVIYRKKRKLTATTPSTGKGQQPDNITMTSISTEQFLNSGEPEAMTTDSLHDDSIVDTEPMAATGDPSTIALLITEATDHELDVTRLVDGIEFPVETRDMTRWTALCHSRFDDLHPHRTDGPAVPWTINTIGLRRLQNGQLDDEAVNYYLKLLCSTHKHIRCETIDSLSVHRFFNLGAVASEHRLIMTHDEQRKLRRYNLYDCDMLLVPLIFAGHITLLTATRQLELITHEDSHNNLHHGGTAKYAEMFRDLLREQWRWRLRNGMITTDTDYNVQWKCEAVPTRQVPQQVGGVDCGVYTCAFATLKALQAPISLFSQQYVPQMRRHMANCILRHICPEIRVARTANETNDPRITANATSHSRPHATVQDRNEEVLISNRTRSKKQREAKEVVLDEAKGKKMKIITIADSDSEDVAELWNFTQCCLPRFRAGDKPKQRRERLATKRTRNTLRKVAMKEPIVSTHDSVSDACVDMSVELSTVDTITMTSNYAMQHHSSSDVSFRTGLEMQTRCDNLEPVELSSPLSLHHMVREESRHSNTRDDCDTTYYLSNTAALEPNELVSSRLEIAELRDFRLSEARSPLQPTHATINAYAMEVPPKRRRIILTNTMNGNKESQESHDDISIAGHEEHRKLPRDRT